MNLAGVYYDVINAYDGTAIEIYLSGCTRNCPECHSPELQDFNYGSELNLASIEKLTEGISRNLEFTDIISFLGGDPLQQDEIKFLGLVVILRLMFPGLKYWLFTGEDDVSKIPNWVWSEFDVVKVGSYRADLHQPGFPASSNQKLLRKGIDY